MGSSNSDKVNVLAEALVNTNGNRLRTDVENTFGPKTKNMTRIRIKTKQKKTIVPRV